LKENVDLSNKHAIPKLLLLNVSLSKSDVFATFKCFQNVKSSHCDFYPPWHSIDLTLLTTCAFSQYKYVLRAHLDT